ncbi:hypothetical protein DFQ27_003270 [Actinomortierella ambigua]|uniref:FAD-binding domain-containing protein n=1 Tax=Actinomortierella ambigua TaxID=1343610 RepID=A0A9P6Q579_9FUNG|nr:hypothetical protein DFQ27_003270 [Actinomortierella ambigua]
MASDTKGVNVIIVGAGIAGLSLGIMLERATDVGIRYTILERAHEFKTIGSSIGLSAQCLRVFDQLGILDDLKSASTNIVGSIYMDQELSVIGRVDSSFCEERYGYGVRLFSRPDLMLALLRHVPEEKIFWGKKVLGLVQDSEGVTVRCADGTTVHGDIVIGADGAYSAVRQSLYETMKKNGAVLKKSETSPLRFDQFSILGTTEKIDHLYKFPEDECKMYNILPSTQEDIYAYTMVFEDGRLGWRLSGPSLARHIKDEANFRFSDWDSESIDDLKRHLSDAPAPIVGTVGKLFEHTESISRILIEDRFYETWWHERTLLIGDACHKVVPAAGQGANQSILDCICLANLLYELPSRDGKDIEKVFTKFYELRAPQARKAVSGSKRLGQLVGAHSFIGTALRTFVLKLMSGSLNVKSLDAMYAGRPILNYLPQIPLKGSLPDNSKPMTFGTTSLGASAV